MPKVFFPLVLICAVALPATAQQAPTRDEMVEQLLRGEREAQPDEESRGFSLGAQRKPAAAAKPAPAPRRAAAARARSGGAAACQFDNAGSALNLCATFAVNSAELTAPARRSLDGVADALVSDARLRGRRFVIEGHADATGEAEKNRRLSAERARAVQGYLIGKGVSPGALSAEGFGSERPIPGRSPRDAANRRVQMRLAAS